MLYSKVNIVLEFLRNKPYILLIIATLFWGGNFVVGRSLVQTLPPFHLSTMRLGIGFILFLPFAWKEFKASKDILMENWKPLVIFAITGIAGFNSLLYVALQTTTSINASLVNATAPLLIVVLSAVFLKERLIKLQYLGVLISFFGVLWVTSQGQLGALLNLKFNKGDLFVILAVLMWAIYSMSMKRWGGPLPRKATFLTTLLLGLIVLMPFLYREMVTTSFDYSQISISMWMRILFIAIFPSLVSFVCWNEGVIAIGPSRASNYLYLVVLFSGVFAVFIGEIYTLVQLIGGVLIISGVLIVSNPRLLKTRKSELKDN
ncbi:MAG: DMT family transporter [Firmicutes bacterium]|nr:DMT family transporter [Bacillota bacterium]